MSNYNEIGKYRLVNGRFSSFKAQVKLWFKRVIKLSLLVGAIYLAFVIGGTLNPQVSYVQAEPITPPVPKILQRIAKCESNTGHYKNGQVVMSANKNDTVDVGKYQINSVWFSKATELGLDITKEEDNEKMAKWIYENRGTGDWSASANCWRK